jgi:hypothetical protein
LHDLANIANEAHVEHAIRFIEYQQLDGAEIDGSLPQVIEQAPRRCDDDINTFAYVRDLRVDTDTTVNYGGAKWQVPAVVTNTVANLGGKLSRRRKYEGTYPPPVHGAVLQSLQQRQGKAGRLAGARLGACEDIVTVENEGYCLLLDRGRLPVTLFIDRTQQFGREAKLIE